MSPESPQPGPISTVGAGWAELAPATGNQWARIFVPSNEVTVQSDGTPVTGVAWTGAATGRWQTGGLHEVVDPLPVAETDDVVVETEDVVVEHPATRAKASAPAASGGRSVRWRRRLGFDPPCPLHGASP